MFRPVLPGRPLASLALFSSKLFFSSLLASSSSPAAILSGSFTPASALAGSLPPLPPMPELPPARAHEPPAPVVERGRRDGVLAACLGRAYVRRGTRLRCPASPWRAIACASRAVRLPGTLSPPVPFVLALRGPRRRTLPLHQPGRRQRGPDRAWQRAAGRAAHARPPVSPRAGPARPGSGRRPRYTRRRAFDRFIFSCRSMHPWISVSGRGGQPGTYTSTGRTPSIPGRTLYESK